MTEKPRRLALIATKGSLDMAYPPFILASTAVALGYEVAIFFSFYGLMLLKRDLGPIKVSPVRNAPMKKKAPNRLLSQYGASDMMRSKPSSVKRYA